MGDTRVPLDALVIGGGPGGLTAALHLVRLRRSVLLVDAGQSRASWIPRTRNHPGFPQGIGGQDLLARLREQLAVHGHAPMRTSIAGLRLADGVFEAVTAAGETLEARHVVLATGVVDVVPLIPSAQQAMRAGHLRQCPICDGYEIADRRVVVIGHGRAGLAEALFLRTYTADLTLATLGHADDLKPEQAQQRAQAGIAIIDAPLAHVTFSEGGATRLTFADGRELVADAVYSALGIEPRTELAAGLGMTLDAGKRVEVDSHQRTSVRGAYAVGDIVTGLNQLGVAMAQGEIAAVDIHNALRACEGLAVVD